MMHDGDCPLDGNLYRGGHCSTADDCHRDGDHPDEHLYLYPPDNHPYPSDLPGNHPGCPDHSYCL